MFEINAIFQCLDPLHVAQRVQVCWRTTQALEE
jgi:hypothetical protein